MESDHFFTLKKIDQFCSKLNKVNRSKPKLNQNWTSLLLLTEVNVREGRLTLIVLSRDGMVSWLLGDVMAVSGGHAHDDVLDHPLRRLLADGL